MRSGLKSAILGTLAALLLCGAYAQAQTYSIDWHTTDGGGGTSSGGVYSVSGTIGQPDAGGPMTGGNYSLTGGFWSLFAVQSPGAPLLSIERLGGVVRVFWPKPSVGFLLDQSFTVTAHGRRFPFPTRRTARTSASRCPHPSGKNSIGCGCPDRQRTWSNQTDPTEPSQQQNK